MTNKQTHYRKNKKQMTRYKQHIRSLNGYENTNNEESFQNLKGSTEEYNSKNNYGNNEKPIGEKRQKIINFIKNHIFEEIIGVIITIILTTSGWAISNINKLKVQAAVFSYRIEIAETNLDKIEGDIATKEYLQQELHILKLQLEKANSQELLSIEAQIKLIEKK